MLSKRVFFGNCVLANINVDEWASKPRIWRVGYFENEVTNFWSISWFPDAERESLKWVAGLDSFGNLLTPRSLRSFSISLKLYSIFSTMISASSQDIICEARINNKRWWWRLVGLSFLPLGSFTSLLTSQASRREVLAVGWLSDNSHSLKSCKKKIFTFLIKCIYFASYLCS